MALTFSPAADPGLLQRVSSFLHDARVVDRRWSVSERRFVMELKRVGYEHAFIISDGFFGFGRRWMYPWVKCELELSPVASVDEERHASGTADFDDVMSVRIDQQRLTIHREFSDISIALLPESAFRLADIGSEIDPNEGLLVIARRPLDISSMRDLL